LAPDVQAFFDGLGNTGDKWSGVMTQYCQGVAAGSTTCPTSAAHVAYPTGGALAGVWEDNAANSPAQSTGHQLAQEAENAATHFGHTTQASNRNAQYVIISPTGTNPDNYQGNGFCAWHDYSGDSTLDGGGSVSGPLIAFTNMPYVPDVGANCGAGFVNPGNALDGVTIVEGHEYAETITDQFPAGGWINTGGAEVGDLCAWVTSGKGRVQNITLTTGTFAVQGIWSNLAHLGAGGCAIKHAIVT
jgi:serine protease